MNTRNPTLEKSTSGDIPFRLLLDGIKDYAIYMLSPTGEITNWNSGAQRIKGYSAEEVIGTHFSRFYIEEDQAKGLPMAALEMASREGRFAAEGWRVRKDGSKFWASVVIDAVRNDTDELVGFAKVTQDITDRKSAAEALDEARSKLFQAQKMESIGKLTGGIAHDFNNLLSIVVNGIEILSRESLGSGGVKVLESMRRAADRGSTLTKQLLAFARQQPLRQEKQDVNRIIGGFEALLRRACDASVRFDISLEPKLNKAVLDISQFETALLNLVVNARDALPNGGSISISTGNVEIGDGEKIAGLAPGRYIRISVSDTGTGMSSSVAERAFEPFFTTKPLGQGTGMGLSQVYGFVAQSGGDVTLSSEIGKGTTVSLYLPSAEESGSDSEESGPVAEKVLIVDDEADVLTVATELFRNMDYDVVTAKDGLDALDVLQRSNDISLVFTDVVMPRMNGIELARRARELFPGIRVIIASGFPQLALSAQHGNLSDFSFVSKPYRFSELARTLRTAG